MSTSKSPSTNSAGRAWARDSLIRLAFVALLILLWQGLHYLLVTSSGTWEPRLFPAPWEVMVRLWDGLGLSTLSLQSLANADYPPAVLASISRLIQGYFISLAIGFPVGLMVARWDLVEKTIGWVALSLQAMPSIGWAPLALLWFGSNSDAPILFVTVFGSLFATILAVSDSIHQVPPLLSRAGRTLGADGPRLYFSVLLPAALPAIVTGLKVGWSFAWRSLLAAELLVQSGGLGQLLQRDRISGQAEGLVATILVIIIISLGVQALIFAPVQRRLQNLWGLSGT